jgi:serine/threonine protein phosphatase PrpC
MMSPVREFATACRASRGARFYQQDSIEIWRPIATIEQCPPVLAVIADGMGGHTSGEVASRMACDCFVQRFISSYENIAKRMEQSLDASNDALGTAIRENGALNGMGCTIVAVYFNHQGLHWISVGDSALLHYRQGVLRRLNADHSVGAKLDSQVERGLVSREAALKDPRRRELLSALTGHPIPLTDHALEPYPLEPSDCAVLATDGLEVLSGDEIASIIHRHESEQNPDTIAGALIAAVEQKRVRHQDNTTVVVVRAK